MFFFFKQKTAYEIVSRDWSSDVCSSDLSNIAGDPANVVVLGDVNINQFDHEHLGEFNISIWELGYGQLINKFTRPKKCTRSNEREGTVLDHIYVKCPKSNELLPSICTRFKKYLKKQAK